jgi:uncharacterized membrane protein SpoIIM required for sporulation
VDIDAFVAAHQAEWDRLDRLVARRRRLSDEEIDELVVGYQRAATHLSALRTDGHDPALIARLATRVARARVAVTGAHAPAWRSVGRFVVVSFPAMAYRARWWWLGTTVGSLLVAFVIAWWIARSPTVQNSLLPPAQARQLVNSQFRDYYSQYAATSFAARVWTNNVYVAALSLIFGILLCLPTLWLLFENALNVGADAGYMFAHGRGVEFFALILPHGMLELSAVFLSAAAGLRLGWKIVDPGPLPRSQALAKAGRETVVLALGMVAVLLTSGIIEAFVTPSPLPTWARIGIGAVAEVAFLTYVIVLGRRAARLGLSPDIAEAPDLTPYYGPGESGAQPIGARRLSG